MIIIPKPPPPPKEALYKTNCFGSLPELPVQPGQGVNWLVEVEAKIRANELGREGLKGIVESLGEDLEVGRIQGRMLVDGPYDIVAMSNTFNLAGIEPV